MANKYIKLTQYKKISLNITIQISDDLPGNQSARFCGHLGSRVLLLCAVGSKIQVWERGSERMAADSNVQVAQVYAAWLNEEPDIRNRKRDGFC